MFAKLLRLLILLILLTLSASIAAAQDDGTTGPTSNVTIFVVICDTRAVMNLTGTMQAGYDLYYQIYNSPGGAGTALTTLRQVSVDGTYAFSESVTYNSGATMAAGAVGSAYVAIARETSSSSTIFTTTVDDVQDGCAEPQNPAGTSVDTGSSAAVSTTTTSSPGTTSAGTSAILSPFGGVLNPNYIPPDDSAVVIGARPEFVMPRQETPGLIFAECNAYPVALPGVVYDNDDVVVFWSWFARTVDQVQQHIDTVNYSVTFYFQLPLPHVVRTEIQRIGSLYWVFYYSRLGNLRPGHYYINYLVTWDEPINDGFDNYGPGTENPVLNSGCGFDIIRNPENRTVVYNSWPWAFIGPTP